MKERLRLKHKIVSAWLFLLVLTTFNVVKDFHHHDPCCDNDKEHSMAQNANHADCPICHFTLDPFTQTQSADLVHIATINSCDRVTPTVDIYTHTLRTFSLRAPPVA